MVYRHIHGTVVTIFTESTTDTGAGYLSHTYSSRYNDPETGAAKGGTVDSPIRSNPLGARATKGNPPAIHGSWSSESLKRKTRVSDREWPTDLPLPGSGTPPDSMKTAPGARSSGQGLDVLKAVVELLGHGLATHSQYFHRVLVNSQLAVGHLHAPYQLLQLVGESIEVVALTFEGENRRLLLFWQKCFPRRFESGSRSLGEGSQGPAGRGPHASTRIN